MALRETILEANILTEGRPVWIWSEEGLKCEGRPLLVDPIFTTHLPYLALTRVRQ
jgi:hypothetical protein